MSITKITPEVKQEMHRLSSRDNHWIIDVRDRKLVIHFQHDYINLGNSHASSPVTTCIVRSKSPLITAYGMSVKNPSDNNDGAIGEQHALKRALEMYWGATDAEYRRNFGSLNRFSDAVRTALFEIKKDFVTPESEAANG